MGIPKNRGFIVENPTKMDDDWGTPIAGTPQVDTGILMVGYLFFLLDNLRNSQNQ